MNQFFSSTQLRQMAAETRAQGIPQPEMEARAADPAEEVLVLAAKKGNRGLAWFRSGSRTLFRRFQPSTRPS